MLRTATSNLADVLRTPEETVQPELDAMAARINAEQVFREVSPTTEVRTI